MDHKNSIRRMEVGIPNKVIVDATTILAANRGESWLFKKIPLMEIIDIFASDTMSGDYEQLLWDVFSKRFDGDFLDENQIQVASLAFEIIVDIYYEEIRQVLGELADEYSFDKWIDKRTFILKRIN